MATKVSETGFFILLVFVMSLYGEIVRVSSSSVCPLVSMTDSILRSQDLCLYMPHLSNFGSAGEFDRVTEWGDVSLQKVLNLVHKNNRDYIAVLFYASWCPFSKTCKPNFAVLSSLYPSILHFAVEESSVMPSILSIYGVHGFPTLFLFNSTVRMRYHGPRTLSSLVAFYTDVTGMKPVLLDETSLEKIGNPSNLPKFKDTEEVSYTSSWARSPEKLLWQEKYLTLATAFVVLRLFYFLLPSILAFSSAAWRRIIRNTRIISLWECPSMFLNQAMQVFKILKEPCKRRSNLQERAIHARTWASKSLASVFNDAASSSQVCAGSERRC